MTAAVQLALIELESTNAQRREHRNYFAKPDEAEWGR